MKPRTAVTLAIFCLLLLGFGLVNGGVVLMALPFVLYLVLSLLYTPEELNLHITRTLPDSRVPAESEVAVTISVTNNGRSLRELLLSDDLPKGLRVTDGGTQKLLALAADESHTFTYKVQVPRGQYNFSPITAVSRDPFALREHAEIQELPAHLFAYLVPRSSNVKQVNIHPRRTRVYSGIIPARVGGDGIDFFGVREYRRGDTQRRINWRAGARHPGDLFTNEFEQERVADVGIILDARIASNIPYGGQSLLEYSIEAVTLMVDALIGQGNRVALLIYGGAVNYTLPGYGKLQKERILQALSGAQLQSSHVFAELRALPTQLFPPQSQIIFVSPLLPSDIPFLRSLRAYDYQVLLVSPNPITYEKRLLPASQDLQLAAQLAHLERELLYGQLLQAGIFVLDWDVERPFDDVARSQLQSTRLTRPV
ncbi:MAG: DUF58 domain-containing protein [Ardenticatenaceae bacterium]|nr:DUF58 domain-containing protein [Ardenticatenaceae bacterium]MCB8947719.1 DUF58 domain-containing protein [Ardenticatenaceae bacterium]